MLAHPETKNGLFLFETSHPSVYSLVGLSGLDSNKYRTLIRRKRQFDYSPTSIVSEIGALSNREIDEFGEVAVKHLKQSYRRDFSENDIELITSSYQSGSATTIDLAKQFGCSKGTINKLLREHGVNITKAKAQAKLDDSVIIAMYEQMHTSEEIGKYFGVNPQVVISCLKKNGVPLRSRWDYYKNNK